jgi:hypothetical protein
LVGLVKVTVGGVAIGWLCETTVTVLPLIRTVVSVSLLLGVVSVNTCFGSTIPRRI